MGWWVVDFKFWELGRSRAINLFFRIHHFRFLFALQLAFRSTIVCSFYKNKVISQKTSFCTKQEHDQRLVSIIIFSPVVYEARPIQQQLVDFAPRQRPGAQCAFCSLRTNALLCLSIHRTHKILCTHHATSTCSQKWKVHWREHTFSVCRRGEGKNGRPTGKGDT